MSLCVLYTAYTTRIARVENYIHLEMLHKIKNILKVKEKLLNFLFAHFDFSMRESEYFVCDIFGFASCANPRT